MLKSENYIFLQYLQMINVQPCKRTGIQAIIKRPKEHIQHDVYMI